MDPATIVRGLGRGINLANALEAPSEGAWGVMLNAEFFPIVREAGFSCIRVPICWSAHAGMRTPFQVDTAFFERVDWVIAQALASQLQVILDFQNYGELVADPAGHEERFLAIWRQIAERYRNEPPTLLFELFNEPYHNLDAARWNRLLARALGEVRETNPTRRVVVGPVELNDVNALPSLILPDDDRHLVVTVHYYDPKPFTHQGAEWVPDSARWLGTMWHGTDVQKSQIDDAMDRAAAWGEGHDRPIFLGEFGVYSEADEESRLRWTRHVARAAEARGMAWAYWEFCSGFGAYDPVAGKWRLPLLNALMDRS